MRDPRDFAADARDQLQAFELAVRRTIGPEGVVVKAVQAQGRKEHRLMWALFEMSRYAGTDGRVRPLGPITPGWIGRKLQLGKSPQRGHFTLGISRTIRSGKAFVRQATGFDIDITLPSLTTRVPLKMAGSRRKGPKSRRVAVNEYLGYYAESHAPGLGALSNAALARIDKARADAEEKELRRLRNIALSAARAGRVRVAQVKLIFERLAA